MFAYSEPDTQTSQYYIQFLVRYGFRFGTGSVPVRYIYIYSYNIQYYIRFSVRYGFWFGTGSVPVRFFTNLQYRTKLVKRSGSIRFGVKINRFSTVFLSISSDFQFGSIFSPSRAQP